MTYCIFGNINLIALIHFVTDGRESPMSNLNPNLCRYCRTRLTRGEEDEAEYGYEAHVAVGGGEGQAQHDEGDAPVLDGRLQRDGDNLHIRD